MPSKYAACRQWFPRVAPCSPLEEAALGCIALYPGLLQPDFRGVRSVVVLWLDSRAPRLNEGSVHLTTGVHIQCLTLKPQYVS